MKITKRDKWESVKWTQKKSKKKKKSRKRRQEKIPEESTKKSGCMFSDILKKVIVHLGLHICVLSLLHIILETLSVEAPLLFLIILTFGNVKGCNFLSTSSFFFLYIILG